MRQLPLTLEAPVDWTNIATDETDLTAVWRRSEFLHQLKKGRDGIAHTIGELEKRKRSLIEHAPEGTDRTAYVAHEFRYDARTRNKLTLFLRSAYPQSNEQRWENVHEAELFNTARSVYRKVGGHTTMPLDHLLSRAAQDRKGRKRLAYAIPLTIGVALRRRTTPIASERDPNAVALVTYQEPGMLTAYSTSQQYWVAFEPLPDTLAQRLGSAGAAQVTQARGIVDRFGQYLNDRYSSASLDVRARTLDPRKRFSI